MERLQPQLTSDVRVLVLTDGGQATVGAKRQRLIREATAEWVSFVDDDDMVPTDHVARILEVQTKAADIIGFRLNYYSDGSRAGYAVHSYDATGWPAPPDVQRGWKRFDRLPNHLNPVRRSIALGVGYKDLAFGEDGDYAQRMAALNPRPREAFIDAPMYDYLFRSKRPEWKR